MNEEIKKLIYEAIEELNEQLDEEQQIEYSEDLRLIGKNAALDSMDFVTLITILEELIEDKLDKSIEIVSDKAFSRTNSPFYSIVTLEEFVLELVNEVE